MSSRSDPLAHVLPAEDGRRAHQSRQRLAMWAAIALVLVWGANFVRDHQARFPVAALCRVLQVSHSGYYAWAKRPPSARATRDALLVPRIIASHERSDRTYGSPRILGDLEDAGEYVGRKRVARLMRMAGITGVSRRRFVITTKRSATEDAPLDLVERNFTATAPNELWVADITYVPTWAGFLYLAIVLDVFSRRIVGGRWQLILKRSWCWMPSTWH